VKSAFNSLLKSRKFLLMLVDVVVSTAVYLTAQYLPGQAELLQQMVLLWQPVIVAVIIGITVEDAAQKYGAARAIVQNFGPPN